jgi:predicted transcriptional regulator
MVREIYRKCDESNSIGAAEDATDALKRMHLSGNSRLIVADGGKLSGILSLKDMLNFLSRKLDLESDETIRTKGV